MFRFKQFVVRQQQCAMKVGTDGVLLGSWCRVPVEGRVLDVGTGTGLLALMVAQRSLKVDITALEIDREASLQAMENCQKSPWRERIKVLHTSLQEFGEMSADRFDMVVCNPPYFDRSLRCPDKKRTTARHSETLSFDDLLHFSAVLLKKEGSLSVVLPEKESEVFKDKAVDKGLFLCRQMNVLPTPKKDVKRRLMEFSFEKKELEARNLVIETERHIYTEEYKNLTQDFYLNF
ncbi:MAG: methyltransferase [Paludibacteraceae bacterium]|nr:methyltransferase [Paludibacteraceae bacterium]